MVNPELREYIENKVYPIYKQNDGAHGMEHINYVTRRSFNFANMVKDQDINADMVFTIAAYHDIGHHIDSENYEKLSAAIFYENNFMKKYFTEEQRMQIKEAIEDHRASLKSEPRNIYGKIVSSADRNTSLDNIFKRTFSYRLKNVIKSNVYEIIEDSKLHIQNKFGKEGYASEKMYFEDKEYENLHEEVVNIVDDQETFKKRYIEINNIGDSEEYIQYIFNELSKNKTLSLDELFYYTYNKLITNKTFEEIKTFLIEKNNINEMEYYLKNVDKPLVDYCEENIISDYEEKGGKSSLIKINEMIRRTFALNETKNLELEPNLLYTMVMFSKIGENINPLMNEDMAYKISGIQFNKDDFMDKFFNKEEKITIREAIESQGLGKDENQENEYTKLLSSSNINSSIILEFILNFLKGKEKMPETSVEEYLEFVYEFYKKTFNFERPENMFYEDEVYNVFLTNMEELLQDKERFKEIYSKANKINSKNGHQKIKDVKPIEKNQSDIFEINTKEKKNKKQKNKRIKK